MAGRRSRPDAARSRSAGAAGAARGGGRLLISRLRRSVSASFDFGWISSFLAPRAVRSMERIGRRSLVRGLRLEGRVYRLELRIGPGAVRARCRPMLGPAVLGVIVERMLDAGTQAEAFHEFARADPVLGPPIARGRLLRLPEIVDPFECLIRAILGQQVSLAAAATLTDRLVRLAGEPAPSVQAQPVGNAAPSEEAALFCFPSPEALRQTGEARLRSIGLPASRAAAVHAAACTEIDWASLREEGAEAAERTLTAIRGVGPWTAAYVCLRGLGDRDAFLASDLGVLKALRRHAGVADAREALLYAERWRPWRGYAVLGLWELLHGVAPGGIRARSAGR